MADAVGNDRISRVVGYMIQKANFATSSPNLPQRIAILGEANTVNQATLDLTAKQLNTAQDAGNNYGYGSPIYQVMRILKPVNGGDGVGGIPIVAYPQAQAVGATEKIVTITPVGVALANGTHTVTIAGRGILDGVSYDINIVAGDSVSTISTKIANAVNACLGSPVYANAAGYDAILTTKWKGLTANELSVSVNLNGNSLGLSYSIFTAQSGSGTPSIAASLALFGNDWNTIVINTYGTQTSVMSALEAFNGIPDPSNPTGRYSGIILKPFIAICGSIADDPSSITDTRLNDVTCAIAPAPASSGFSFEAAANMAYLFALQAQNSPHLDVSGQTYPDMPTPTSIGSMQTYTNRDAIVKKGCSTVDLVGGRYTVMDFVTTYHPLGENPPQFRYCRNLNIDWNVRYGYYLLELDNVVDHLIANDNDTVTATNVVKPKMWTAILDSYADDLVSRGLMVQADFMKNSITVSLSTTNPDRLQTFFRYKRSGFARISSTVAQAGFNFGTQN